MKRPERAKRAARPKKAVRRRTIPRGPVRDKRHPLKVLAICYGGVRSGLVEKVINKALKEMKFGKVVKMQVRGMGDLSKETLGRFDIIITPRTEGLDQSLNLLPTVQALLKENRYRAFSYETFSNNQPREMGEEIVNRILRRAETFLDLRF